MNTCFGHHESSILRRWQNHTRLLLSISSFTVSVANIMFLISSFRQQLYVFYPHTSHPYINMGSTMVWPILFVFFLVMVLSYHTAQSPNYFSCFLYSVFQVLIIYSVTVQNDPEILKLTPQISHRNLQPYILFFFRLTSNPHFLYSSYNRVNMNSMSKVSCAKATWSSTKLTVNRWASPISKSISPHFSFHCSSEDKLQPCLRPLVDHIGSDNSLPCLSTLYRSEIIRTD